MPKVLVVGDVMTDIVVRPAGPLAPGADTRATIRALPGGSGANQAAWLASEGITTVFAGRAGRADRDAQAALLAAHGVTPVLAADDEAPTGTIVALLAPDGERSFFTDRGANARLSEEDLQDTLLDGVDLLHVSGYALFEAGPRAAVLALVAKSRARGIPFSIDPASYSFLEEVGPQKFLEWTKGARFAFPNTDEAVMLAGTAALDAQLDTLRRVYGTVVIKRGAAGAVAADARGRAEVAAPTIAAIDTSGAGDAFLAGFLAAHLNGGGLEDALERGVALGSAAAQRVGARP